MPVKWMGDEVYKQVVTAVVDGVTEFGLTHETEAKRELVPKHGVLTGTLRRSIHAANPSYDFAGDNVPPSPSSPERSGQGLDISKRTVHIRVAVGSGMIYAHYIEKLYSYITGSHGRVIGKLPDIIKKHAGRKGLL